MMSLFIVVALLLTLNLVASQTQTVNGASGFQYVLSYQPTSKDVGAAAFNTLFWGSSSKILLRECPGCTSAWRYIYYKRLRDDKVDLYGLTDNWFSKDSNGLSNLLNVDFELYSTLQDALAGTNRWTFCNYDDPNIGMFRDCGPTGYQPIEWTSRIRGGDRANFYIYTANKDACQAYGEGLYQSHECSCSSSCSNYYCNTLDFVENRLAVTNADDTGFCPTGEECCCNCPNCRGPK